MYSTCESHAMSKRGRRRSRKLSPRQRAFRSRKRSRRSDRSYRSIPSLFKKWSKSRKVSPLVSNPKSGSGSSPAECFVSNPKSGSGSSPAECFVNRTTVSAISELIKGPLSWFGVKGDIESLQICDAHLSDEYNLCFRLRGEPVSLRYAKDAIHLVSGDTQALMLRLGHYDDNTLKNKCGQLMLGKHFSPRKNTWPQRTALDEMISFAFRCFLRSRNIDLVAYNLDLYIQFVEPKELWVTKKKTKEGETTTILKATWSVDTTDERIVVTVTCEFEFFGTIRKNVSVSRTYSKHDLLGFSASSSRSDRVDAPQTKDTPSFFETIIDALIGPRGV
jgi:hypothetical protein